MTAITTEPLTPERWPDLVEVFGPSGAYCGCWCMYWRVPRSEFIVYPERKRKMKARFKKRVKAGPPPGLIAYADCQQSVGWVQVGPRADVPNWNGARRLSAPPGDVDPDDPGAWGISCFVIRKEWRGKGVSSALLAGAVDWARSNGARLLEACPVEPAEWKKARVSLYHGVASIFMRAGFREIARRRADRPLLRLTLET